LLIEAMKMNFHLGPAALKQSASRIDRRTVLQVDFHVLILLVQWVCIVSIRVWSKQKRKSPRKAGCKWNAIDLAKSTYL